jgi:SAM-dependent methyltransferase
MTKAYDTIAYHLGELDIVRNPHDVRRIVPRLGDGESRVLDVGCGIGQTLVASELERATVRCGIDVDPIAIEFGRRNFPRLDLRVAALEKLPFDEASFDLVIARVSLPYTDMPVALREIHRVLRKDGRLWAIFHPWKMERDRILRALSSPKELADRAYVVANSALLYAFKRSLSRPWSTTHETFQTVGGMRRLLQHNGFGHIDTQLDRHFKMEARKERDVNLQHGAEQRMEGRLNKRGG